MPVAEPREELSWQEVRAHDDVGPHARDALNERQEAEVLHPPLEGRLCTPLVRRVVGEAEDVLEHGPRARAGPSGAGGGLHLLCKRNHVKRNHVPGAGKESRDCKGNTQIGTRATENGT